jgi:putative phage-type endonuclease
VATQFHILREIIMSFSKEVLDERRKTLGASEVSSVVGVNPYSNAHTVWQSKVLGFDFEGNEATEIGTHMEGPVFELFAKKCEREGLPRPTLNARRFIGPESWMSATPDGIHANGAIIEVKVTGPRSYGGWGAPGTEDIPLHYRCQVQWQLLVTKAPYCDVVMSCGTTFNTYRIHPDLEAQMLLFRHCKTFWFDNVVGETMPDVDGSPDCSLGLLRLYPDTCQDVMVSTPELEDMVDLYFSSKKEHEGAKEKFDAAVNSIKSVIGERAGIDGAGWQARWTKTKAGYKTFRITKKDIK